VLFFGFLLQYSIAIKEMTNKPAKNKIHVICCLQQAMAKIGKTTIPNAENADNRALRIIADKL